MKTIQKLIKTMYEGEKAGEKFSLSGAENLLLLSKQGAMDVFNFGVDNKFFIETSDISWALTELTTNNLKTSLEFKDNSFDDFIKPLHKFYKKIFRLDEVSYFSEAEILRIFDDNPKAAIFLISKQLLHDFKFVTLYDTQDLYIFSKGVYKLAGEKVIAQKVEGWLRSKNSTHTTFEVIGHIKRSTFIERKDFFKAPDLNLICLKNGILNLETSELSDFNEELVFLSKIPVTFDAECKCPKIMKFLSEIVDEKDIVILQEYAGYMLLRSMPFHKALMFLGFGSNGKSVMISLLKNFIGVENCTAVSMQQLEASRFSAYALFGKLANLFADLPSASLRYCSQFKLATGGDLIPAERKFKDPFYFVNHAKFIFSANQLPKVYDDSDAFFRRWIILNFPNQFTQNGTGQTANPKILDELISQQELSGFLNFALEGLKRILSESKFSFSATTAEVREEYIKKSDSIGAFYLDMLEISTDDYVPKKDLYLAYTEYCRSKKYPILSDITFHKNLLTHVSLQDFRPLLYGRRVSCWKGIKIQEKVKEEEVEVEHVKS